MAAFEVGDRVAWDHEEATKHADGSIVREDAFKANAPAARFGAVLAVANDEGTWFDVKLDDGTDITLTADELVKVAQ